MISGAAITGATGFIGRKVTEVLRQQGIPCWLYSRQALHGFQKVISYADVPASPERTLIHLAQTRDVGAAITLSEQETCAELFAKKWRHVVYISSAVVYGDGENYLRSPAEKVEAFNAYTETKLACEALALDHGATCLRLANVYGEGMAKHNVLSDILAQLGKDGPLALRDDTPTRDFIHVSDIATAIAAAHERQPQGVLNVGTGIGTSIREIARLALDLAGEHRRSIAIAAPSSRKSHLVLDISRTVTVLEWRPKVTITQGLSALIKGN